MTILFFSVFWINYFIVPTNHLIIPADHFIVQADHLIALADNFIVLADHFIVPPDHFIIPADNFIVLADHLIVPADHFIFPADNFIVLADHFIVPANHFFVLAWCLIDRFKILRLSSNLFYLSLGTIFYLTTIFKNTTQWDREHNFISGKDGNAQFTKVPLKALADQVWIGYVCL